MNNEQCRVSIEENNYQHWLEQPAEEYWDEGAAIDAYYDEKHGAD